MFLLWNVKEIKNINTVQYLFVAEARDINEWKWSNERRIGLWYCFTSRGNSGHSSDYSHIGRIWSNIQGIFDDDSILNSSVHLFIMNNKHSVMTYFFFLSLVIRSSIQTGNQFKQCSWVGRGRLCSIFNDILISCMLIMLFISFLMLRNEIW